MHDDRFARLPEPPYYAVIFSSRRRGDAAAGYAEAAMRMEELVAAQAQPDRVWLKDIGGDYLRGRASGDVAMILREALLASGMDDADLPVCLDETLAARAALAWARSGDLLVLPVHELAHRDAVVALLDRLQADGWRAGEPLPPP